MQGLLERPICLGPLPRKKEALRVGLPYAGHEYKSKQDCNVGKKKKKKDCNVDHTKPNGYRCGKEKPRHRNAEAALGVHC